MSEPADLRSGSASAAGEAGGRVDQSALEAWGRSIGEAAATGAVALPLVIALRGPLGAGKSVLARAVARGAGVEGAMPSPTYNLVFTYQGAGGVRVRHLDLYRLEDPEDVWELGWRELGVGRELVLIEWPSRAEALLPPDRWEVRLGPEPGEPALRRIVVEVTGDAPEPRAWPGGRAG